MILRSSKPAGPSAGSSIGLPFLLAQFLLALICVAVLIRVWRMDLRVPFNYWGDSIFELMLAKSIVDDGWIWFVERLGAPFGLEIAAFPQNLVFSSLVMRVIAMFTREPGLVLNLFWIFSVALTSVVCNLALRPLGLGKRSTLVLATLYAMLPHAFYRNIAHISLTYMFVPVICAQALLVLSRARQPVEGVQRRLPVWVLVFSCLAIGADYIYTAFFSCFFLATAGVAAFVMSRRRSALVSTMPLVALIGVAAIVNLSPSLLSWHQLGAPSTINYKGPAEAEFYGLKIRHLVSPVASDLLAPDDVAYPLENENAWAKLGAVGGVGFVLALGAALFARREGENNQLWAAGALAVFGLLLATVGGFGAIFNVLVVPDIRAYNRISVFIAFFSFYVLFEVAERLRARLAVRRPVGAERLFSVGLGALFVTGVWDQGLAARDLVRNYQQYLQRFEVEREFVTRIEASAPDTRQVFQLPMAPFPGDGGQERMMAYDHGRPYLWSQRLRWSWPALSDAQVAFESRLQGKDPEALIPQLLSTGFDGIWIDRFGYQSELARKLERDVASVVKREPLVSADGRYVFFDLSPEAAAWLAATSPDERRWQRDVLMQSVLVKYGEGFFAEERAQDASRMHRWSDRTSTLTFRNPGQAPGRVEFLALVQGSAGAVLSIDRPDGVRQRVELSNGQGQLTLSIDVPPKQRVSVKLSVDGPPVLAPADPRSLFFVLINPRARTMAPPRKEVSRERQSAAPA